MSEVLRLQAALAAIHNHLHAGNVNAAHEACECAMTGAAISQPNLTVVDSANVQVFASRFNDLCKELGAHAAFVAFLPSATKPGFTSIQMGGSVDVCKFIERGLNQSSTYQGEHA